MVSLAFRFYLVHWGQGERGKTDWPLEEMTTYVRENFYLCEKAPVTPLSQLSKVRGRPRTQGSFAASVHFKIPGILSSMPLSLNRQVLSLHSLAAAWTEAKIVCFQNKPNQYIEGVG